MGALGSDSDIPHGEKKARWGGYDAYTSLVDG